MKTLVVVFAFCLVGALALSDLRKAQLARFRTSCAIETSINLQLIEDVKRQTIPMNDERLGCFTYCILRKMGIVEENGNLWIKNNVARHQLIVWGSPWNTANKLVRKCQNITGANECKKASNLVGCFMKNKSSYKRLLHITKLLSSNE
ncbi:uncharacterized protein LOC132912325 [Bombus pascuorum]|uniref:uncharacterized protein LOC132912325 n=1 Tax=Bombus pascuorum TaxID=65598 RepID=UPI002128AB82|nr:uncharacterized protein LOC132912325 [Bombus pascuorum]